MKWKRPVLWKIEKIEHREPYKTVNLSKNPINRRIGAMEVTLEFSINWLWEELLKSELRLWKDWVLEDKDPDNLLQIKKQCPRYIEPQQVCLPFLSL